VAGLLTQLTQPTALTQLIFKGEIMKRKTWYWIIGLGLATLVVCGGFMGLGLMVAGSLGVDSGLPLGDAVAIVRVEGTILPGEAPPPGLFDSGSVGAFSETIVDQLKQANDNSDVKACGASGGQPRRQRVRLG
jgi:hypothetical protein